MTIAIPSQESLVRLLFAVGGVVTGVASTVVGSWISSKIHVYHENRRVHLEEIKQKVGAGDTFPGAEKVVSFDNTTKPTTEGTISVCGIAENSQAVDLSMYISRGTCRGNAATKNVSVNELLQFPLAHISEAVVVQGLLRNEATNYFRDPLNLKLRDRHGGELAVIPWVPKERPPGPRGTGPPVLSEFLNHEVELIGRLEEVHPHKYALRVESARTLDYPPNSEPH